MSTIYIVFLATGPIEIQADLVRETGSFFDGPDGQEPAVCFYRGFTPNKDKCVGQFMLKNIAGYAEKSQVKFIDTPNAPAHLLR